MMSAMDNAARTPRYNKIYLTAVEMKKAGERITPMTLARKAGYNHPSRISNTLKALEIDRMILRINHTWHAVEIVVL